MAIVYHPANVDAGRLAAAANGAERRFGWSAALYATTAADGGRSVTRAALSLRPDLVIAAGGDGTVRDVAAVLRGLSIPLGVIPAGSTNLFATNLGIGRRSYDEALRVIATGARIRVGAGRVHLTGCGPDIHHDFFVQTGFGVSELMVRGTRTHHKAALRWMAYTPAIVRSVVTGESRTVSYLDAAGRRTTHAAHSAFVGTCGRIPPGINILPGADPRRDSMAMLLLSPVTAGNLVRLAGWLIRANGTPGTASRQPRSALCYSTGSSFSLELDRPTAFQADGDFIGCATAVDIDYSPGELDVVLPGSG